MKLPLVRHDSIDTPWRSRGRVRRSPLAGTDGEHTLQKSERENTNTKTESHPNQQQHMHTRSHYNRTHTSVRRCGVLRRALSVYQPYA